MTRHIVLLAGLALSTLGMAIAFVGILSPGLFYPGIYLIAAGLLVVAIAGVLYVTGPEHA